MSIQKEKAMRVVFLLLPLLLVACGNSSSVTFKMDNFVIPAGGEGYRCQEFPNPLGEDLQVTGYRSNLVTGAHHLLAFAVAAPTHTTLFGCGPAMDSDNMLFQAQIAGDNQVHYPDGVTTRIGKAAGIRLRIHFLNASTHDITTDNRIELFLAQAGTVKEHVGPIHLSNTQINLPAGSAGATVSQTCKLDQDIQVAWFTGHMHSHRIDFKISSGNTQLYEATDWTEPPVKVFDPPLELKAGESFTWSCGYGQVGDQPVQFGLSLVTNELCNVAGAYFLPDGGDSPALACAGQATGCLRCVGAVTTEHPEQACTDNGPPSSAQRVQDLNTCTCGKCANACADSGCAGKMPSGPCQTCVKSSCATEASACFNEPA